MDNERYAVRKKIYDEIYFVRPRKSLKDLGVGTFFMTMTFLSLYKFVKGKIQSHFQIGF